MPQTDGAKFKTSYGVNLGSEGYQTEINPYYKKYRGSATNGRGGQCTWYCWGRAYEKLGVKLPGFIGNANNWYNAAKSAGLSVGKDPAANAIMVDTSGDPGHVMFVEKIVGNTAYITEGNYNYGEYSGEYHEDTINLTTMKKAGNKNPLNKESIRYIYLKGKPKVEYTLDVNGILDGENPGNTKGYGTFDITVNDKKVGDDVTDYYNTELAGGTDRDSEGTWGWVTGESFSYAAWNDGEPNNYAGNEGSEDFLCMTAEGRWNDLGGNAVYGFVCEFDRVVTVSYDAAGGEDAPEAQVKGVGETLTLSSAVPTRSCHYFLGWSVSPGDSVIFDGAVVTDGAAEPDYRPGDEYAGDEDLTLYALWAEGDPDDPEADVHVWDDGTVDRKDRIHLARHLAGWEGYDL